LHQITHVGVSPSRSLKLLGRVFIFEVFQPMWSRYLNVTDTDGWMDGRTDGRTTYCGITALCV